MAVLCRIGFLGGYALFGIAGVVAFVRFPAVVILLAFLVTLAKKRSWKGSGYAHGTATTTTLLQLLVRGLLGNRSGILIGKTGYLPQPSRKEGFLALITRGLPASLACQIYLSAVLSTRFRSAQYIRIREGTHGCVIASTGAGKGVSFVIPNLLACDGPFVTIDIKGENYRITAEHRRRLFGHRIVLIDPFNVCGTGRSDCINPLDLIDHNAADFIDRVRDLAAALVVIKGTESEPHWNESAIIILACFIAFVCVGVTVKERRNLMTVRELLISKERYEESLKVMKQMDACVGLIRRLAEAASWHLGEEGASVMTTVLRHTAWLESPAVAAVMSRSTFHPRGLRTGRMDVYIAIPPERLGSMPNLARTLLDTVLNALTREGANEHLTKVTFLLDEYAQLGRLPSVENAVQLMRGYGVKLWFIFQTPGQLQDCFGQQINKFLDNMDTQLYFGVNSIESADLISKRAGDATIVTESFNRSTSYSRPDRHRAGDQGGQVSTSTGITFSEIGRAIIRSDEVLRSPTDLGFLFHRNLPMTPVELVRYYDDPAFRHGVFDPGGGLSPLAWPLAVLMMLGGLSMILAAAAIEAPPAHRFAPPVIPAPVVQPTFPSTQWMVPPPPPQPAFPFRQPERVTPIFINPGRQRFVPGASGPGGFRTGPSDSPR